MNHSTFLQNYQSVKPDNSKKLDISFQNMDRTSSFRLASATRRTLIVFINSAVNILLVLMGFYVVKYCFEYNTILPQLGYFGIWLAGYTYLNSAFGVNPGAIVFSAKIVDEEGKYISTTHALFRNFPFLVSMILHTCMLLHTLIEVHISYSPKSWLDIIEVYRVNSPFFFQLLIGVQIFVVLDLLSVIFHSEKRALRDFLAESYVIEKNSYNRIVVDRTRFSGNYHHKSAEEKRNEAEKDQEFMALNLIMEIPEVMKEVKKIHATPHRKMTAKILSKPSAHDPYYHILFKENGNLSYTFRVLLDKMLVQVKDDKDWLDVTQWRKKYLSAKDRFKTFLFFMN